MKRQQIYRVELTVNQLDADAPHMENAIKTLQTAVLLSLLEKGQLSKRQFDLCLEKMHTEVPPYA